MTVSGSTYIFWSFWDINFIVSLHGVHFQTWLFTKPVLVVIKCSLAGSKVLDLILCGVLVDLPMPRTSYYDKTAVQCLLVSNNGLTKINLWHKNTWLKEVQQKAWNIFKIMCTTVYFILAGKLSTTTRSLPIMLILKSTYLYSVFKQIITNCAV